VDEFITGEKVCLGRGFSRNKGKHGKGNLKKKKKTAAVSSSCSMLETEEAKRSLSGGLKGRSAASNKEGRGTYTAPNSANRSWPFSAIQAQTLRPYEEKGKRDRTESKDGRLTIIRGR